MKITLEFDNREEYLQYIQDEAMGRALTVKSDMQHPVEDILAARKLMDEAPVPDEPEVTPSFTDEDRQRLKDRLDELGVEYNNRARTETLAQLLEDFEANYTEHEEPAPEPDPIPEEVEEQEQSEGDETYTAEDVTEWLKKVMAEKGMDTAREILKKYEAKNVSSLDADNYVYVVGDCMEVLP